MSRVDLRGKPIVITGASSGIGRATALACARAGMPVALNARGAGKLAQVATDVRALGVGAVEVAGNAADESVRSELLEAAAGLGPVYAVFANAGYGHEVPTLEMDDADIRAMFEVNFFASLALVRAAAPTMVERREGHLLMCSSCLSKIGLPKYAAYCATKAAQDHFCRAMRHELASSHVLVSSVHPIGTKTDFFDRMSERSGGLTLMDRSKESFMQSPDVVAETIVRRLGTGRGGEIWTSMGMRIMLGLSVAIPSATDRVLRRLVASRSEL
ncbi:MAG: SDR family oxidoreductase [Planctomycetota bacterium]